MIRIRNLVRFVLESRTHIWIDIVFVRETPKAILIIFDGQKVWIPKAWIYRIKCNKGHHVIASPAKRGEAISIKISDYNWSKKFA